MPGHRQHVACRIGAGMEGKRRVCSAGGRGPRGMGRGKAARERRMGGKRGDVQQERGIGENAPSQPYGWALCRLRVQAPNFPRQPLITAVPHVPLQARNSRYITGDVGGAPPGLRFITARQTTLQEEAIPLRSRSPGLACPPSCSPHRDNELAAAARAGDGWQHSTGCLCLQEMLPAVHSFSLDAKMSPY